MSFKQYAAAISTFLFQPDTHWSALQCGAVCVWTPQIYLPSFNYVLQVIYRIYFGRSAFYIINIKSYFLWVSCHILYIGNVLSQRIPQCFQYSVYLRSKIFPPNNIMARLFTISGLKLFYTCMFVFVHILFLRIITYVYILCIYYVDTLCNQYC